MSAEHLKPIVSFLSEWRQPGLSVDWYLSDKCVQMAYGVQCRMDACIGAVQRFALIGDSGACLGTTESHIYHSGESVGCGKRATLDDRHLHILAIFVPNAEARTRYGLRTWRVVVVISGFRYIELQTDFGYKRWETVIIFQLSDVW